MKLVHVPLLQVQRRLHDIPRDEIVRGMPRRFLEYLRTMSTADGSSLEFPPLVGINPMAKDGVTRLLDALLAIDADGIAARAVAEASACLDDSPGDLKTTLIVMDDWMGWAQRAPFELDLRRGGPPRDALPRWLKDHWLTGVLWSSEPASELAARQAMLSAVHRLGYQQRNGPARTLRDLLAQEGCVLVAAGWTPPILDPEELEYTREVLHPHLDAEDPRTLIECLFGDAAARALGFTPRGLSSWAGLSHAVESARARARGPQPPAAS